MSDRRYGHFFIDLALTRLLAASLLDDTPQPHKTASHNSKRQCTATLQLLPHPNLLDPAIAALDYAMQSDVPAQPTLVAKPSRIIPEK